MRIPLCLLLIAASSVFARNPPVILISIDTLRADHLSTYGYRRVRTPNLDSYAQNGTVFEQVSAQIPLTLPSHTSLFTSTYPFQNGIEENAEILPAGMGPTLASTLRGRGYQTAAFIGSVFLEKEMGLDAGFDLYDSPFRYTALSPLSGSMFLGKTPQGSYSGASTRDGALVIRSAVQWLRDHRSEPTFAFLHLYDLHTPYRRAAKATLGASTGGYDNELEYVDQILGKFKKILADEGWWDQSLVIVLGDHGESLGEHGEGTHGYFIYESTLHVPLIVHWPDGSVHPGGRVSQPAGLIDVAPTVLDFLGIPAPASFVGTSLLRQSPTVVFGESFHCHDSFGWAPLLSARVGDFKYIDAPHPELYNLHVDPGELHNLIASAPREASALRERLNHLLATHARRTEAAATAEVSSSHAMLRSLGYLASGPGVKRGSTGPDAKDKLPEFQLYESAMLALYKGQMEKAAGILRRIVKEDPGDTLARRDLGSIYFEQKQYAKARECLHKVLATAPTDYVTNFELGLAAAHLGLVSEARGYLQTACRLAPAAEQCRHELDALPKQAN